MLRHDSQDLVERPVTMRSFSKVICGGLTLSVSRQIVHPPWSEQAIGHADCRVLV